MADGLEKEDSPASTGREDATPAEETATPKDAKVEEKKSFGTKLKNWWDGLGLDLITVLTMAKCVAF